MSRPDLRRIRMKRRFMTVLGAVAAFAMIGVAGAMAVGVPEIDNANATFQVKPVNTPVTTSCAGEDATTYKKFTANWKGGEVDFTPGSTDYVLSGTLTFQQAVWTVNTSTGRGVFKASAKLKSGTNVPLYSGSITLITQNIPGRRWRRLAGGSWPRRTAGTRRIPPGARMAELARQRRGVHPAERELRHLRAVR
jgi:hypothetical protein